MAPSLAAGCAIVMKPAEITPLTTIKVTELAEEAGFPQGVVNTVLGPGRSVGAELAENFSSEAEAVQRANNTLYGLSAGFRSRDPDRIHRVSRALKFGTVWVNDFNIYFAQAPWGGYKQSSMGRELGRIGMEE